MRNQSDKPRLMIFFDPFVTLSAIREVGFLSRMVQLYKMYTEHFDKVYIKSYDNNKFTDLPERVEHIPFPNFPLGRYFYFLFSGFLNYKHVDCVEISDPRAIGPSFVHKFMGVSLFLHYRWNAAVIAADRKGPLLGFLTKIVQIIAFKVSDVIAVTSKELRDEVKKYTREDKIYFLPNFVDTDHFKPMKTRKIPNLLVFVGRLHVEKNLHMLLHVMKDLPQHKLWIIGEGPLRNELITIKENYKIENVKFLGSILNKKLPHYLNMAEAFIIVSHREGNPKALIEAMACGLPSIGTKVSGIREVIVDGKTGLLCNKTVEDIRKSILKLFENREKMREMGEMARKFAVENYSMFRVVMRQIKMIKRM